MPITKLVKTNFGPLPFSQFSEFSLENGFQGCTKAHLHVVKRANCYYSYLLTCSTRYVTWTKSVTAYSSRGILKFHISNMNVPMLLYTMVQIDFIYDICLLSYSCLNVTCESAATTTNFGPLPFSQFSEFSLENGFQGCTKAHLHVVKRANCYHSYLPTYSTRYVTWTKSVTAYSSRRILKFHISNMNAPMLLYTMVQLDFI